MKRNNEACRVTRSYRRRKGLEKIRRVYGDDVYTWEIPALLAVETDVAKRGVLLSVLETLGEKERTEAESERLKKVAEEAEKECKMLMEKWGLV